MPVSSRLPIRVLLCIDNFDTGGTQTQLVRLANALVDDPDIDLRIACLKRRGPLLDDLLVPADRVSEYALRRFYDPHGLSQIGRFAADVIRHDIAVVHAQDFYSNVLAAAATGLMRGRRLVVSRRYETLSTHRRHAIGERLTYAMADRVVLNSRLVAESLERSGMLRHGKAAVIPNGLDIARFESPAVRSLAGGGSCRIGVVATLMDYKGHEILLQAAALLRRSWPEVRLQLVGDGPLRGSIERQVAALGLSMNVELVGSQRDVRPFIQAWDVAVLSSHTEGLPNALLEYLAAGRPVIATRVGAIPEIVTDGIEGVLVPPGDPQALATALDGALRDDVGRRRMSDAARRRAADFAVPRMVASMRDLYLELATAGRSSRAPTFSPRDTAYVRHLR